MLAASMQLLPSTILAPALAQYVYLSVCLFTAMYCLRCGACFSVLIVVVIEMEFV